MPTRNDVARIAGVSSATVSRVYNDQGNVSDEKCKRVLSAAKKIGYIPDKNASSLRRSGSGAIAFLEQSGGNGIAYERYYSWLYAEVIRSVKEVINKSPFNLILLSVSSAKEIKDLVKQNVCDAIICHELSDQSLISAVQGTGIPSVFCYREYNPHLNTVMLDEISGGTIVAERFRAAGVIKPAHITSGMKTSRVCMERWQGFSKIYSENSTRVINGNFGIRGGYESAMQLIPEIKSNKIDGIFAVNDLIAVGVVQALQENRIMIPEQVSVCGYGNIPFIDTLTVGLTTIDEQMSLIYKQATELILKKLKQGGTFHEFVRPVLMERASVRKEPV